MTLKVLTMARLCSYEFSFGGTWASNDWQTSQKKKPNLACSNNDAVLMFSHKPIYVCEVHLYVRYTKDAGVWKGAIEKTLS